MLSSFSFNESVVVVFFFTSGTIFSFFFITIVFKIVFFRLKIKRNLKKEIGNIVNLFNSGNWKVAEEKILTLLTKKGFVKELFLMYIQLLRKTSRIVEAKKFLSKALDKFPKNNLFSIEKAYICFALQEIEEAKKILDMRRFFLKKTEDIFLYSQVLFFSCLYNESYSVLKKILDRDVTAEIAAFSGRLFLKINKYEESLKWTKKAISLGSRSYVIFHNLAYIYFFMGFYSKAKRFFTFLLKHFSDNSDFFLHIGLCEEKVGEYKKALTIYQTSALWKQADPRLMLQGGLCAFSLGDFSLAERCFSFLSPFLKNMEDPRLFLYYAYSLETQEKWEKAYEIYKNALSVYPDFHAAEKAISRLFGLGLFKGISSTEGLYYAYRMIDFESSKDNFEILSACEARSGNFNKAYKIQIQLVSLDKTPEEQKRRQKLLRLLRKNEPLSLNELKDITVLIAA